MASTIAIVCLAALSVVTLPACAVVRTCKKVRRKKRDRDSALALEAEGRLSRIMTESQRCGA